ncbi:hypothetical protein BC834DRAFT_121530 [Gloeopeniophorella convolvens]|nr:hypothetical protein BC834DRAFT_121530 [Gloeopeniophorella convolvens]
MKLPPSPIGESPLTPRGRKATSILFYSALLLTLLVNVVLIVVQVRHISPPTREYTYIGRDHPRELPLKVGTVNAVFENDTEHYAVDHTVRSWTEWNTIRPPGNGHVFLGKGKLPYGVAMWHQIHCLAHIRANFIKGQMPGIHLQHCFNYLREAILCNADTTLEEGGMSMRAASGVGTVAPRTHATHTCRDWRQVYDYLAAEYDKWTPGMRELVEGVDNATVLATPEDIPVS